MITTNNHHIEHAADAEFLDHLERELRFNVRRRSQFPALRSKPRRAARLLALIALVAVCSTALGASGTFMMTAQSRGHYRLALLRAEMALKLAHEAEMHVAEQAGDIEAMVSSGRASASEMEEWEIRMASAREATRLRTLDLREVELRRAAPVDDITADRPGHDFVLERLVVRLDAAAERAGQYGRAVQRAHELVQSGVASRRHLLEAMAPVEESELMVRHLQSMIDLRQRFNAGEISAERAELEVLLLRAMSDREALFQAEQRAGERVHETAQMVDRAAAPPRELRAAEHEYEMITMKLSSVDMQIDLIQEMIDELEAGSKN